MKMLDDVKVINLKDKYKKLGVSLDDVGTIIEACIREDSFLVVFPAKDVYKDEDYFVNIKIEDLKLVKDNKCSDEILLDDIPKHDPGWWCKVENGYIINLLGERKNKIPYVYNS